MTREARGREEEGGSDARDQADGDGERGRGGMGRVGLVGLTGPRRERKGGEEEGGLGWFGERRKFSFFIFLTQTSFEQKIYFDFKLNLNFGCYKA